MKCSSTIKLAHNPRSETSFTKWLIFILHHFTFLLSFFLCINLLKASTITKPEALIFVVIKDGIKNQYYTQIDMGTPTSNVYAVLDLGGQLTWFDCESGYTSSSYKPIRCDSKRCTQAKGAGCLDCILPHRPGCTNNTCGALPYNPYKNLLISEGLGEDVMEVYHTDGQFYEQTSSMPHYQFSCAHIFQLQGLSTATRGMVGLARTRTSLHKQLSLAFKLPHKFALCAPASDAFYAGSMFIGGGPYYVAPYAKDVSKELFATPLLINPVSTAYSYTEGDPSDEYFIGVKSIKVDNKILTLNAALLSIDKKGYGGTKLSTVTPFTVLERSIYRAIVGEFVKKATLMKMERVATVAPFGACFSSNSVGSGMTGPKVPVIDLVLQSEKVFWRIYGANSMVKVKGGALGFAFVDGGLKPRTSIVLGGFQLENNLVEFDIASSMLGFTSSLLAKNTTCSQNTHVSSG